MFFCILGKTWVIPSSTLALLDNWWSIGNRDGNEDWWKIISACIWWIVWKERNGDWWWNGEVKGKVEAKKAAYANYWNARTKKRSERIRKFIRCIKVEEVKHSINRFSTGIVSLPNEFLVEFWKSIDNASVEWLTILFDVTLKTTNAQRREVKHNGFVLQEKGRYPKLRKIIKMRCLGVCFVYDILLMDEICNRVNQGWSCGDQFGSLTGFVMLPVIVVMPSSLLFFFVFGFVALELEGLSKTTYLPPRDSGTATCGLITIMLSTSNKDSHSFYEASDISNF
ncbi:hypothetical protein H5410_056991 [Solanum commersonii]|uniref:Uncharacterized protein n=1 Tax=Solanum commersonii TaxID=4109 RepID=A0A9J5WLQ7_SOLCO|nr:hypothetical protein H5410_056991 [Solanum commersonii]